MGDTDRLTMDIPSAAALLGISRNLGYELARRGDFPIPILKLGRRLVCSRQALLRLLEGAEIQQSSEDVGTQC